MNNHFEICLKEALFKKDVFSIEIICHRMIDLIGEEESLEILKKLVDELSIIK